MSDCCCQANTYNSTPCPSCGHDSKPVSIKTVLHHLVHPYGFDPKNQDIYFCENSECDVVYYFGNDETIGLDQIRVDVGIKSHKPESMLCYCFNITFNDVASNSALKEHVIELTRKGLCECEVRNPSGRCCLKDFPD